MQPTSATKLVRSGTDPIKHVVYIMFENQSFLRMLGAMVSVYENMRGVDINNPKFCLNKSGRKFFQKAIRNSGLPKFGPEHSLADTSIQMNLGQMDGFIIDYQEQHPECSEDDLQEIMDYFEYGALPADHVLARCFQMFDNWRASVPGPTWPNRMFSLAGTTDGLINMTAGLSHRLEWMKLDLTTLFDRLNEAEIDWKCFYHDVPLSWIIKSLRRPQNASRYFQMPEFFKACAGPESEFPQFAYIEPCWYGLQGNSDLWPADQMLGQKLKADIYNAIMANEELRNSTLFIITYDEHGGYFDDLYPPAAVPPDSHREEWSFNQYGIRIPTILVSPWVQAGCNSELFDHTSVLKYLQDKWGLGDLGARTAQATSFAHLIGNMNEPRTDFPLHIKIPGALLEPLGKEADAIQKSFMGDLHRGATELIHDLAIRDGPPVYAKLARAIEWFNTRVLRKSLDTHRRKTLNKRCAKLSDLAKYKKVIDLSPKFAEHARAQSAAGQQ